MYLNEKLSYYLNKSKELVNKKFEKKIHVALLSSFTINGLEETLRVKCAEEKLECITYVGGYNQYNQEILKNNSTLYQFSPDVTFLLIDTRNVMGDAFFNPYKLNVNLRKEYVAKKSAEIINLVKIFVKNSNSKLVISNFVVPTYSPLGIFETKTEYGIQEMVNELNENLARSFSDQPLVYLYDFNGFVTKYGEKNIFDYRQYYFGDIKVSIDHLPHLAHDLMGYIKAINGSNKKCMVLDLDNTLWGGIVGEDGFSGIKLGTDPIGKSYVEFQHYLLALNQRGIILAVNSKNNFDDAIKVIKEHPNMILREENFACMKINWNDKISNFNEIAKELNIGLDSMVFFDDDPVNRELVRMNMPEILTVDLPSDPSYYVQTLLNMNDFNVLKITDEDKNRGKMYLEQRKRSEFEKNVTNFDEFLKQLNIKIKIKKANEFTIPRISQLTLKTNQFNLTTRRYQEEDIRSFSQDPKKLVGCAQIEDKFGDNGITGVYIINKDSSDQWTIDTFLLSCRVLGRKVEDGILCYIINKAKKEGVKKIRSEFIPTKKNKAAEDFLPNFGFQKNGEFWIYSIDSHEKKLVDLEIKED